MRVKAFSKAALTASLGMTLLASAAPIGAEDINRIVLRVNNEILTLHDYETRKASEISTVLGNPRLGTSERQEILASVGKRLMQQMFRELLLKSRASQLSIRVEESQIDDALLDIQQRQGYNSHQELLAALEAAGLTLERLRENLRQEILWSQVVGREVTQKMQIGEEELRAYYRNHPEEFSLPEERHLSEVIVLESSSLSAAERRRVATEIHAELASGGDFEEVVAPYRDQEVATGVIDLDWLTADELEPGIAETAWKVEPGDFSPPVEGRGGLHIIHVKGVKEATTLPFNEVQDEILRRERGRRFDSELRTYLADLEKSSYIQENLPSDAVGYRELVDPTTSEDEIELFRQPLTNDTAEGTEQETDDTGE